MSNEEILKVLNGFIQFTDEVLPKAGTLFFDVGNLNDTLILGRKLQKELRKGLAVHVSDVSEEHDIDALFDLLSLVKDEFPAIISIELLKMLKDETLLECTRWAAAVYASASDNDVEIPEMPEVLKG